MQLEGYGIAAADRARARYSLDRVARETVAVYEHARQPAVSIAAVEDLPAGQDLAGIEELAAIEDIDGRPRDAGLTLLTPAPVTPAPAGHPLRRGARPAAVYAAANEAAAGYAAADRRRSVTRWSVTRRSVTRRRTRW